MYTYNSDNLLTAITAAPSLTTSYADDGNNQRVAATENDTETDFVLDPNASDALVLQETTGDSTTTYTYGLGLISRETASGISYLLSDDQGSVRLETDASADVTRSYSYDAFGNELDTQDLSGNRFRYTGQWSDASGLVFLRARFYDPQTGTFLSVDPVPSAASPYVYCQNNPLMRVDPSGRWSFLGFDSSSWLAGLKGGCNFAAGFGDFFTGMFGYHIAQPYGGPGLNLSYRIGWGDALVCSVVAGRGGTVPAPAAIEDEAAARAGELQDLLPHGSAGRVTRAVGIGEDGSGCLRTVVGTSEPGGYLRPGVAAAIRDSEEIATG